MNIDWKNIALSSAHGLWTGAIAGAVGGGLFGIFVMFLEQIDRGFYDIDLIESIFRAPGFALIGAIIGTPFGLIFGLVCALFVYSWFEPQQLVRVGLIGGALAGTLIGISLQGISGPDWLTYLIEIILVLSGTLTGGIGGWVNGKLYARFAYNRPLRR